MANINAAFGLRPVGYIGGRPYTGSVNMYTWPSGSSGVLAKGSIVKMTGTGRDVIVAASGDDAIAGVVMGFRYVDASGNTFITDYLPSGQTTFGAADVEVMVADDPDLIFECQSDATGIAETDVGQFFAITVGTVDAAMKQARTVATGVTGTATTLKLLGLSKRPRPGNVPASNEYGAYAVGQFILAEHYLRAKPAAQ